MKWSFPITSSTTGRQHSAPKFVSKSNKARTFSHARQVAAIRDLAGKFIPGMVSRAHAGGIISLRVQASAKPFMFHVSFWTDSSNLKLEVIAVRKLSVKNLLVGRKTTRLQYTRPRLKCRF